jgi:hypothetical protein
LVLGAVDKNGLQESQEDVRRHENKYKIQILILASQLKKRAYIMLFLNK